MTLEKRVTDKLEELGLSLEYVARKYGVSAGAVFKVANGKTKKPGFIVELADILGVSVTWLQRGIDGPEEKSRKVQPTREEKSSLPYLNMLDTIPLYGPASAGSEKVYLTEDSVIGKEPRPPALQGVKGGFMMLVAGDCMEPRMFKGNKLWVHPYDRPLTTDDCIIVMKEDGNASVKEYVGETAIEVKLTQLNPKKNISIKKVDIEKMFVIVGIQRR